MARARRPGRRVEVAGRVRPSRCQNTDDLERDVVDGDALPDGVDSSEQFGRGGGPEDGDGRRSRVVGGREEPSLELDRAGADLDPGRRRADDRRRPVGGPVDQFFGGRLGRCDADDVRRRELGPERRGVGDGQRGRRAEAAADACRARGAAWGHDQQVAAQCRDLRLDRRGGALTQPDGQHYGGDTDEDAEHGQARPQPVCPHGLKSGADRLEPVHRSASSFVAGLHGVVQHEPVEHPDDPAGSVAPRHARG